MAIAFDTSSKKTVTTTGTSITWSHTCTGSNLILIASVMWRANAAETLTGITYNGVAMTSISDVSGGTSSHVSTYYLINPTTGANNIVATWSAAPYNMTGIGASYTGAKQTGQPDSSNTGTGTGTTLTIATTVVASNCWTVGAFGCSAYSSDATLAGTSSNKTDRQKLTSHSAVVAPFLLCDSNTTVATGSQSIILTQDGGTKSNRGTVFSISPYVASGPANLKSYNTNVKANIKSIDTNLIANVKSLNTNV